MSDRPPCPVREPTPTLDAFWLVVAPTGRPRFYTPPDPNSLGDVDEALGMYEAKADPFNGNEPIAPQTLALVSVVDYANALSYPTRYVRWCLDYNNGKNASVPLPAPIVLPPPVVNDPIARARVDDAIVATNPAVTQKGVAQLVRQPPIAKPKGSLLSRFGSWFSSPVFK